MPTSRVHQHAWGYGVQATCTRETTRAASSEPLKTKAENRVVRWDVPNVESSGGFLHNLPATTHSYQRESE